VLYFLWGFAESVKHSESVIEILAAFGTGVGRNVGGSAGIVGATIGLLATSLTLMARDVTWTDASTTT
jgi:hypothetical protein